MRNQNFGKRVRDDLRYARAKFDAATTGAKVSIPSGLILALFTGAISFVASTFTSMYRESDNAAIRVDDARELRAQLIRCRDREADRTDRWMRLLYGEKHGSDGE